MKHQKLYALLTVVLLAFNAYAQKVSKIYVFRPGTLMTVVSTDEAKEITHLKVEGKLNAADFRCLRDSFGQLRMLDISQVSITRYAGKNGTCDGFHVYAANTIPPYAFCRLAQDNTCTGSKTLSRITLPGNLKAIETAAFKDCRNLRICQIRNTDAPKLHAEALSDTVSAIFLPVGSSDAYRKRKEWENFALVEGEPVGTRVEIGPMSNLAGELIRKGVQPKDINYLTIKGKMDEADFLLIRDYMPDLVYLNMEEADATTIPEYTFTQKKYLLRILLSRNLKSIGQRAFSGCKRLCGTLILPPTVTAIEFGAFMGCDNLLGVIITGSSITTIGDKLFGEEKDRLIYINQ